MLVIPHFNPFFSCSLPLHTFRLSCICLCKVIFKYVRNLCKIDEMAQEFKCAQVSIGIGPEIEISAELGISITVLILYLTLGVVHVRKQEY